MLVMYGDYQGPRSADVYKLIKAIKQGLVLLLEKIIHASSSAIFHKHGFIPMLDGQPKLPKPLRPKDSFG